MLIENPDAFKTWLTSVLEPLCDADPGALAKYVFALVKKDKSDDDLRQGMLDQLDVFLQAETRPFVDLLFRSLETQDYLTPTIPNTNPPNPNIPPVILPPPVEDPIIKDIKPIIPVSTLPNLTDTINGSLKKEEPPVVVVVKPREDRVRSGRGRHRSGSRNRTRSRSWDRNKRSRTRERSPRTDRSPRERRSRPWRNKSPPRGGNRYDRRRSRSTSPPSGRIRSRSRSPRHTYNRGNRYRNRSPPRSLTRSRSRSNDRNRLDKDKKDLKTQDLKEIKEENSGGATPTQDSNHGDTDMRLTNTTQSIQSVVSALNPAAAESRTGGATFGSGKRRCRDFDEKGYCMRGEMCPYDHGVDPVVLEDSALSRVLTFGPGGPNGAPAGVVDTGVALAPPVLMHHQPMLAPQNQGQIYIRPGVHEYNPSAPGMWHRPPFRGGPRGPMLGPRGGPLPPNVGGPFTPLPSMQRELINVPVMDNSGFKRHFEGSPADGATVAMGPTAAKRKSGFDFNRLGPRAKNPINCSLELKKVPRGLNNITHLNNHFSKFGKIVNIQVSYDGDPEAAIVTFSSHAEANAAYRSTEAVLNNRFIKVFWHSSANNNGENKQENVPPVPLVVGPQQRPVKDRLGQPVPTNNNNKVFNLVQPKVDTNLPPPSLPAGVLSDDKKVYVPSMVNSGTTTIPPKQETKALANAAIVKSQEILAAKEQLKKKHEEKRKEALKITQDLRKRKQELLEKQLAQQKLLIEKLEKTNPTGQQRDLLMSTIKTVQESIESIRKELVNQPTAIIKPTAPAAVPKKSKEEAQKEVLDAELDLISKQAEGGDTSELQKRLLELRAQASYLITRSPRGGGSGGMRGGGARRGRGALLRSMHLLTKNNLVVNHLVARGRGTTTTAQRGFQKQHTVVDHRPTRLLVSGYEADEADSVLAHFAQFGEILNYITDESTPSIVLNYKTRKEAEVALMKGKQFQDRTLSVTWCNGTQLNNQRTNSHKVLLNEAITEEQLLEGDDETVLNESLTTDLSEEALLQDDEDDDDENEDRSWRR